MCIRDRRFDLWTLATSGDSPCELGQLRVRTRCGLRVGCPSGAASAPGAPSSRCVYSSASGLR
eukprot:14843329-Alexandrium_andersonii.AAC.1